MKYHVSINSIYLEIVKIRYSNSEYMKCKVRWYSKASGALIQEDRSLKIKRSVIKFWGRYED